MKYSSNDKCKNIAWKDARVGKLDIDDLKYPTETCIPKFCHFLPNPQKHAHRINQEASTRKISTTSKPWQGPETYTIARECDGYGFTIRYFIVHPPNISSPSPSSNHEKGFNRNSYWSDQGLIGDDEIFTSQEQPAPLDTFFVKTVTPGSTADKAGLRSGDRIVSINGDLIGGKTFKDVIEVIQYCAGDLKVGVVPRDEDILQLVFEEYVYNGSSVTSENNRNSQNSTTSSNMPQPSVNKWSAPITTRKSVSLDSPTAVPNINNSIEENSDKKMGPCVQFFGGTPIVKADSKNSRSNSLSSSGSITPLHKPDKGSPSQRTSTASFDPCVSFISGKPQVSNESPKEENGSITSGVQPYKLQNALRKEVQKKSYSVGTRLAPKPIAGVSKPGAVSNIAGLFASGNVEELQSTNLSRKKSATFVLRDDFQIRSCKNKVQGEERKISVDKQKNKEVKEPQRQRNNLSSSTTQATLVESKTSCHISKGVSALVSNTIVINGGRNGITNIHSTKDQTYSPISQRKRTLLSNGRKSSVSSSLENSEDEDSHVESADECALENWSGRRISYLMATAKKAEQAGKKNMELNAEADDEDSDVNANVKVKLADQKSVEGEVKPIIKEGPLNRKLERSLDRKKASGRTWKPIYAVLKGHRLFCYKEGSSDADDDIIQPIPVRSTIIEIANDYVKRKHVFRMVTSHGNEYLFQAEDTTSLVSWVNTLRDANPDKESLMKSTATIKQEKMEENDSQSNSNLTVSGKNSSSKDKKGLSIRRSHFGLRGSKKSRVPNVPPRIPKEDVAGKTFGLHLRDCPPSKTLKNIPLLLEHCCKTIEDIGKDLVGIYRVSGNVASVQLLKTELDTKDANEIDWEDDKWRDPNNVGSLLKSFLRSLADPLIPNDMYMMMIHSNRVADPTERLYAIKNTIKSLPEYHFESVMFLVKHLKTMSDNKEKNKMGAENMAIVFGPNIIRTNTVTAMVQDMSDQCKIVEMLIKQCDWMFSYDDDCGQPIKIENDTEVISVGISKQLMDCLNQKVTMTTTEENDTSTKKGKKFSTLKSNLSMKLRNTGTKVVSPRTPKKSSKGAPQDDEIETDEESGCYSQSPPTLNKNEKTKQSKYRSKEIHRVNNAITFPRRQSNDNGAITTKIGNVLLNSEVRMQFNTGLKSPELSPQLDRNKPCSNDDGNDSGVTSPQRIDSDDNMSVYSDSGAQSSRKASFDSASGLSPRIERRVNYPRQQSIGSCSSNGDKSPPVQKSLIGSPSYLSVQEEQDMAFFRKDSTRLSGRRNRSNKEIQVTSDNPDDSSGVVKRSEVRRRNLPVSPRAFKRELYSILPDDGNDYEEKIRALIDPNYEGDMKELAQSEMTKSENLAVPPPMQTTQTLERSKTPDGSPNTDWWLSGSQNISRRIFHPPKDKAAALNIISNVIDHNRIRKGSSESQEISSQEEALRRNPILSPTIVRRTGFPSMATYYPELSTRTDTFNQKQEENDKRVRNILLTTKQGSTKSSTETTAADKLKKVNDLKPTSTLSESQSEKLDRYLKQVSELLSGNQQTGDEREKINSILKSFQTACDTLESTPRRVNSESRRRPDVNHSTLNRSLSGPMRRSGNNKSHERTSPLLDTTYSDLNYSKLYPR